MTLELLQSITDNNIHLRGHQYQIIQVIEKTCSMALIRSIRNTESLIRSIQNTESLIRSIQNTESLIKSIQNTESLIKSIQTIESDCQ